jgi:hypothetical protein
MSQSTIFWFIFFSIGGVTFYIVKGYLEGSKNTFEKRLDSYQPKSTLPLERKTYLERRKRFVRCIFGVIIGGFIAVPFLFVVLCIDFNTFQQENVERYHILSVLLLYAVISFLPYLGILFYWLYFMTNKTTRAQQMLLGEMSEEDFQYFNEIRRINIFQNYTPPFLVCKGNLYLFKFSHIIEIPIATIRNISIRPLVIEKLIPRKYNGGDRVVITHTEKTSIYMHRNLYSYLTTLIYKYQLKT